MEPASFPLACESGDFSAPFPPAATRERAPKLAEASPYVPRIGGSLNPPPPDNNNNVAVYAPAESRHHCEISFRGSARDVLAICPLGGAAPSEPLKTLLTAFGLRIPVFINGNLKIRPTSSATLSVSRPETPSGEPPDYSISNNNASSVCEVRTHRPRRCPPDTCLRLFQLWFFPGSRERHRESSNGNVGLATHGGARVRRLRCRAAPSDAFISPHAHAAALHGPDTHPSQSR